jgi:hypothetical protein
MVICDFHGDWRFSIVLPDCAYEEGLRQPLNLPWGGFAQRQIFQLYLMCIAPTVEMGSLFLGRMWI